MARNSKLAKSIYDVAWGNFVTILEAVALRSGVRLVKVAPHNTTVDCSGCGTKVPKTLSVRLHKCPKCNLEMDRDENASINILKKGLTAVGLTVAACRRLSGSTPDDAGMPNCEVGMPLLTALRGIGGEDVTYCTLTAKIKRDRTQAKKLRLTRYEFVTAQKQPGIR